MFLFGLLTLALAFVGLEGEWFGAMPFQLVVGLAATPMVLWALAGRRAPATDASSSSADSPAGHGRTTGQTAYGPIRAAESSSVLTPRPAPPVETFAAPVDTVAPAPLPYVPVPPVPPRVVTPVVEPLRSAPPAASAADDARATPGPLSTAPAEFPARQDPAAAVTYEGIAQVVASTLAQLGLTPPLQPGAPVPPVSSPAAAAPEPEPAPAPEPAAISETPEAPVEPKRLLPAGWRGRPRARVAAAGGPTPSGDTAPRVAPTVAGPIRLESDAPRPAPAPADLQYADSAAAVAASPARNLNASDRPFAGGGTLPPMADATPWPAAAAFHGTAAPATTAQESSDRRAGRWQQVGEADIAVDSARERRIVWAQIAIAITLAIIVIIRARHWLTGDLAP